MSVRRTVLRTSSRAARVAGALLALAVAAVVLPTAAPGGQSSPAPPAPFAQVAAGLYHSCALIDDGSLPPPAGRPLRCWGFSGDGQVGYGNRNVIGDDETPSAAGPVDVGVGRTVTALAAGDYHTCAVLDDGAVRCWGYANEGQLGYANRNQIGDNETPGSVGPVRLGAGRTATAITAGGNHTCAVLDNGSVRCWGLGASGQLGYGTTDWIGDTEEPDSVGPVNFGAGRTAKAVTAGLAHTCVILDDDSARCWGLGGNGQLGTAATAAVQDPSTLGPIDLGAGRSARAITAGASHTCAILDDGSVRCWGLNDTGQLGSANMISIGDNETPGSVAPVDLGAGRTASAISAGGEHTCAVLDNGAVRCWGSGLYGQLGQANLSAIGDNEAPGSVAPVDLGAGRTATAVVAGIYHTCVRLDDAGVRCWGNGANGRLGLCAVADIGDDEPVAAVARVDIGFGGAACPAAPLPPPPPPAAITPPPAAAPAAAAAPAVPAAPLSALERGQRAERLRAARLRSCRASVLGSERRARSRARVRYRANARLRAAVLRTAKRRAGQGRVRCLNRHARIPGRVRTIAAKGSNRRIILTFRAAGSHGSREPAARGYVVKQSTRPIRTARDFRRAPALCKGTCAFVVDAVGARITLDVTRLRPRRTYYYSVAARDNVSRRTGPRSRAVRARTR